MKLNGLLNGYQQFRRAYCRHSEGRSVSRSTPILLLPNLVLHQWRTEGGSNPSPEIPKALQNRAKLNPIVKNVKNC